MSSISPTIYDNYLDSQFANTNRGTSTETRCINVFSHSTTINRPVIAISLAGIAAGSVIVTAPLTLTVTTFTSAAGVNLNIRRIIATTIIADGSKNESETTYNSATTGNAWNTAGADGAETDYTATNAQSLAEPTAVGQTLVIETRKFIQAALDAGQSWCIIAIYPSSGCSMRFGAKENATESNRPTWPVTYLIPSESYTETFTTAGATTWTPPGHISIYTGEATGAGGGGGGNTTVPTKTGGGGGGGGNHKRTDLTCTPETAINLVVGTGGTGGGVGTDGTDGTDSTINTTDVVGGAGTKGRATSTAGTGGSFGSNGTQHTGGNGGTGSIPGEDLDTAGGAGGGEAASETSDGNVGSDGTSTAGGAGGTGTAGADGGNGTTTDGNNGDNYGGGGAGAGEAGTAGGSGGTGKIIITYMAPPSSNIVSVISRLSRMMLLGVR